MFAQEVGSCCPNVGSTQVTSGKGRELPLVSDVFGRVIVVELAALAKARPVKARATTQQLSSPRGAAARARARGEDADVKQAASSSMMDERVWVAVRSQDVVDRAWWWWQCQQQKCDSDHVDPQATDDSCSLSGSMSMSLSLSVASAVPRRRQHQQDTSKTVRLPQGPMSSAWSRKYLGGREVLRSKGNQPLDCQVRVDGLSRLGGSRPG